MLLVALLVCAALPHAWGNQLWKDVCSQPDVASSPWCDVTKDHVTRAKAFVAALKTEEKVPIMTNEAQGVKRLHIPPYQWGSEGLHGPLEPCVCGASSSSTAAGAGAGPVTKCACPTSFPAPSAMGSAFNTSLYWLIGHHDGIEARAINNLRNHATQNNYGDGIDYWSPTVNMQRDPVRLRLSLFPL
jgi:beta-D-xylosidase 4